MNYARIWAAAYRLAALFGWEDTLYTHFSVRLPGDGEPRFLINPFGMMFDEVTASNLIVVDMQGKVVEGHAPANSAGFTIHSAVHMAREDAHCVIHTHTLPGMAVAAASRDCYSLTRSAPSFISASAITRMRAWRLTSTNANVFSARWGIISP